MAGAPLGNQNAAKAKKWTAAIERVLTKRSGSEQMAEIDRLAEKLVDAAAAGDLAALREFGDRIEGKPAQSVTLAGDPEAPLETKMEVVLVTPGGDTGKP